VATGYSLTDHSGILLRQEDGMTITQELADILGGVKRPGDYFVAGRAEFLAPRLEVEGVGAVALPLLPVQAKQLIKAATRAPYGRGSDTFVDTKVRRTWQIEADRVRIGGKHWGQTLDGIVARAAEGLGVAEPVTVQLYKLLIYDKGSFFVSHRDTEKAPGMFATLVVALPSQSEGGELIVRHKDREARLDLRCDEPSELAFVAFYADCVHEVLPVTRGCRATLVFNLVRKGKGAAPQPPAYEAEAAQVADLLSAWTEAKARPNQATDDIDGVGDMEGSLQKLVYPLEHAYTPAELAFDKLKGADAAVARLLRAAAPRAGCDLHLSLLTVWESGSAQYNGSYRRRYRRSWHDEDNDEDGDDHDEFEVVEVLDGDKTLSDWRRPDGELTTLGKLPIMDSEVSPPDALDDMEPDEEHFREATGNEGASFERTYARAALVLWPTTRILVVLNQAGLAATLPYLDELIEKWKADGAAKTSPHWGQAHELAGHMLATWREQVWCARDRPEPSDMALMLGLLTRLGDRTLVEAMIDKLMAQRGHDKADNAAILEAMGLFPVDRAAELLQAIVASNSVEALGGCAALLADASHGAFPKNPARLINAATTLVEAMPGDPASAPKDKWARPRVSRPDAAFVVDLVGVVHRVNETLAKRAAAHLLAWPRHYDLDAVLVPAIKRLIAAKCKAGCAFEALHAAAVAHLQARIAEPLEAPKDRVRPNRIGCPCAHCSELSRFLADATSESWTLRAAERIRRHVEDEIRRTRADVDTRTERRGSPHSLICTKNQASYQRRVALRKQDLADIKKLEGWRGRNVRRHQ
jgi:predicted 2-oxoglutarate/Fe(II)-dependent dioxygenase YbiX